MPSRVAWGYLRTLLSPPLGTPGAGGEEAKGCRMPQDAAITPLGERDGFAPGMGTASGCCEQRGSSPPPRAAFSCEEITARQRVIWLRGRR